MHRFYFFVLGVIDSAYSFVIFILYPWYKNEIKLKTYARNYKILKIWNDTVANSKLNPFTGSRDFRSSEIRGRDSRDSKSRKRTEARGWSSRRAGNKVDCAGGVNSNCRLNEQRQHARRKCASSATFIPLSRIKRKEGKKIKKNKKKGKREKEEKKRGAHTPVKGKRKQGREKKGARGNSTCPLKSFAASMLAPLSPLHSTCSRLVPFFFVATRASNLDYPASPRFGFAKSTDIVRFINTPPRFVE